MILQVIVAAIASFALGMLWYGPLFSKKWMQLNKFNKKDLKPTPLPFVIGFLRQVVSATVVSVIIGGVGINAGLVTAIVLWLGFTAMPALSPVLWEKKPWGLYAINVSYELVSFLIMTALITLWV